ncbi:hypothetical protein [Alteromonas lipolytica]|uniref:Uncharacterized protein n=1 Tax=Alteromonas lipolytica TaxID=1856405 RepID=A0A1E8FC03_9ALTE|nr:hypothetical protein [Alteromonas lipolytica]OFI33440.1 hypothetical protein BFC17_04055 [Alteromonas lipolytica]GGF59675.1 hypothetical protein GCM10011338_09890 [Alteromonas lipolytica]
MAINASEQCGDFALVMVNDIVLINALGPWNNECVESFGLTYANTVYQSGNTKWADIVVLNGESLLQAAAEFALRPRIERAVGGGLSAVFVVTGSSSVAAKAMEQLRGIYQDLPLAVEFVVNLTDAIDGCQRQGFNPDAGAIDKFFQTAI